MNQKQSDERKFRIEVENLFDKEKRKLKVTHKTKEGGFVSEKEIDYPPFVGQTGPKNREKFFLKFGDSLEIDILSQAGGGESTKFWYIKLPFVADFRLLSKNEKKPLIYELARNQGTSGRTVAFIPQEKTPGSSKLLISPPGAIEENYKMRNLTGDLESMGDEIPDDHVSVGDNGEG
jgi:hypothetical protein